jgi:phospholipid:diacylglycerol acyltransferase
MKEKLEAMGYNQEQVHVACYDWRLSLAALERRDGYYSKLKEHIERLYTASNQQPVALISHSFGGNVAFYFTQWLVSEFKDGAEWISRYLGPFTNVAVPMLGAPKAIAVAITGTTSELTTFGALGETLMESLLSTVGGEARRRIDLFQTWGSIAELQPKGGDNVWGRTRPLLPVRDKKGAPQVPDPGDPFESSKSSFVGVIRETMNSLLNRFLKQKNKKELLPATPMLHIAPGKQDTDKEQTLSPSLSLQWLSENAHGNLPPLLGHPSSSPSVDPMRSPLPKVAASSRFKLVCLYGVGIGTEVGYHLYPSSTNVGTWKINVNYNSDTSKNGVEFSDG